MKYVTRTIETHKAKVKIIDNDGKVSEREFSVVGGDLLKEIKKEYPKSRIVFREVSREQNKYRMSYEDFLKHAELVK
jgi:hypothetical protein